MQDMKTRTTNLYTISVLLLVFMIVILYIEPPNLGTTNSDQVKVGLPLPGIRMDWNIWAEPSIRSVLHQVLKALKQFHHGQVLFQSPHTDMII